LQITGAEKPSLWRLLGIRFILLPYTIGKLATWQGWWIWRYWIKKKSYTWEDAAFLTCSYLAIPNSVWNSMSMGSLTLFGSSKQKSVQLLEKKIWRNQIMRIGNQHYIHVFIHSTICTITGH
jgi:DnaJ family protein C protein 25